MKNSHKILMKEIPKRKKNTANDSGQKTPKEISIIEGTYNILFPQYIQQSLEEFQQIPLENNIESILEKVPISLAVVLCRRHPELLIYFLKFFNHSPKAKSNPKIYLPFICQWVNKIPIQWIVMHTHKILDVRYAYLLVSATFTTHSTFSYDEYSHTQQLTEIWKNYRRLVPNIPDQSIQEAWEQLTNLRTSIIELKDLKLTVPIPLSEYIRYDKYGFITNLMNSCTTSTKLIQFIRAHAISFCQSNNLSLDDVIIDSVVRRDWDVSKKISILSNYIQDQTKLAAALEKMTFQNDNELSAIKDYAKSTNISFTTSPNNYIRSKLSPRPKLFRSNSNENFSQQDSVGSPLKRCPSSDTISIKNVIYYGSLKQLANGQPENPENYAQKLEDFKEMTEIIPIYKLATQYKEVISYEDYQVYEIKKRLFIRLINKFGYDYFSDLVQTLSFEKESVIDIISTYPDFQAHANDVIPRILPYLTNFNWEICLSYLIESSQNFPLDLTIDLWLKLLEAAIKCTTADKVIEISNSIAVLKGLVKIPETNRNIIFNLIKEHADFENLKTYLRDNNFQKFFSLILFDYPIKPEDIKDGLLSDNTDKLILSIQSLTLMNSKDVSDLLIPLLNIIDGRDHKKLLLIYHILFMNHLSYEKQMTILGVLIDGDLVSIDFHKLMKNPLEIINEAVTHDNINIMIALSSILNVKTDQIILHLMIKKMRSANFNDYAPLIALLTSKSSKEVMIHQLAPRFKFTNLISFYKAIGEINKVNEIKIKEILSHKEFQDQAKESHMNDPSRIICELYSSTKLQEKLGYQLHSIMKGLAQSNGLSISKIREHLVNTWLSENKASTITPQTSIFSETAYEHEVHDDQVNVQRALFIMRVWKIRNAVKWLLLFIYQNKSYRSRAKALQCLFVLADEKDISECYTRDFDELLMKQRTIYIGRILEVFGMDASDEMFNEGNIKQTIDELSSKINENDGAAMALMEIMKLYRIEDEVLAVKVLKSVYKNHKLFLLQNIHDFMREKVLIKNAQIQSIFLKTISYGFSEMANKENTVIPFKARHFTVFRDVLDTVSISTIPISEFFLNDESITMSNAISRLSDSGWPKQICEFCSHIGDNTIRDTTIDILIQKCHFDIPFMFGFDDGKICESIFNKGLLDEATKTMVDSSFITFTKWLKEKNHDDSIQHVFETLRDQGRIQEIHRMKVRLGISD